MFDLKKIHELSVGIDEQIRKLTSFVDLMREIKFSLEEIKNSQEQHYMYELQKVKDEVNELSKQLRLRGLPESNKYEMEFEKIKSMIWSSDWPVAVDPELICDSEEKSIKRANTILDIFIGEHLKDVKFLDYGCGEGHVVKQAVEREVALSVGYDLKKLKFNSDNDAFFTDNIKEVAECGPYDIILMYDVLDHCSIDPVECLKQVKSLLSQEGRLYLRAHPWSSRHGSDMYPKINKAFIHLVLDDVELVRLGGFSYETNLKICNPIDTYQKWFKQAGLEIKLELPSKTPVEKFFKDMSVVRERLESKWGDGEMIESHMEIDFIDYILEKDKLDHQIL